MPTWRSSIDDASRYLVVVPVPDETGRSAALALEAAAIEFARVGIRIERVLTDNGAGYRSHAYADAIDGLDARHKRTRPWRPQTNGKAERVIQTLLREWAYGRPYATNQERDMALPVFVDFYNRARFIIGRHRPWTWERRLMRPMMLDRRRFLKLAASRQSDPQPGRTLIRRWRAVRGVVKLGHTDPRTEHDP